MMDLNSLRKQVSQEGYTPVDGKVIQVAPVGATYQSYLDFTYATGEERKRMADENDTTPEKFEASLLRLAAMRGEVPEEKVSGTPESE